MRRSGPSGSSGSSPNSGFRGAEQSLHIMSQVKSYFNVGMDHVLEVGADMAEYGKDDEAQGEKLKKIMLNYLEMEREMDIFMTATKDVISEWDQCQETEMGGLTKRLEQLVKERMDGLCDQSLQEHEKFQELKLKILESQNPDAAPNAIEGASAAPTGGGGEEKDLEMTEACLSTRCPYTGKELEDPVRNIVCGHSYERTGIQQHIKKRGKKAMCPIIGCSNNKPITSRDLEENAELKQYIQKMKQIAAAEPSSVTI